MKRFKFPLKSVLTIRSMREQQARETFGAAARAVAASEESLARVRARVAEVEGVLREGQQRTFRPREHVEFVAAYRQECANEQQAQEALAKARAQLDAMRNAWLEARRHLQVIENLQTRARRRHQLETERTEQAALDEHAALRATRVADPLS